jgi:hypothetical protein
VKATVVLRTRIKTRLQPSFSVSTLWRAASNSLKKAKIAHGMELPVVLSSMVIGRNGRLLRQLANSTWCAFQELASEAAA